MFKMPLVNFIGITPNNMHFLMCCAFMPSETVKEYEFAFHFLGRLYQSVEKEYPGIDMEPPATILGDDDARQMVAAEVVFPNTQFRLCIWNVNATIQAKLLPQIEAEADSMFSDSSDEERKKTIDETWKIFKKDWMSALRAKSLAIWLSNWKRFREDYENRFPSVIAYIQTDIVNNYAKQLVKCWTDRQHNWGIQATRGGGQSLLKNELGTSRGDTVSGQ